MKTTIQLSIIVAAAFGWLSGFVQAQTCGNGFLQPKCNPAIPSDAVVVQGFQTFTSVNMVCYWVCAGDSLRLDSAANCQVYGEPGAWVRLLGGENYVWLLDNGFCRIDSGALSNWVRRRANTTLNDFGGLTKDTICPNLSFNYTNAPSSGCSTTAVEDMKARDRDLRVLPNPARQQLMIISGQPFQTIEMMDSRGRICLKLATETVKRRQLINISNLSPGIYWLKIDFNNTQAYRKIQIID